MSLRFKFFCMSAVVSLLSSTGFAEIYEQQKFAKLQKEEKKIVLQFHADWCPTCKKQKKALGEISVNPGFSKITFLEANLDNEDNLKKNLSIKGQSTLVYFLGSKEMGRSQGVADKEKIIEQIKLNLEKKVMEYFFSYVAGLLTTLSPCVLPVLPFILNAAIQRGKVAPMFICLGLANSFVLVGWSLASSGYLLGFDAKQIRTVAGIGFVVFGCSILIPKAGELLAQALTRLTSKIGSLHYANNNQSNFGFFLTGVLLGVVWTPCSGPTLGSAVALASQQGEQIKSLVVMIVFSIGACTPLILFSLGADKYFTTSKKSLLKNSSYLKIIFGILLLVIGVSVLAGWDKTAEAQLVNLLPESWLDLVTKF